MEVRSRLAAAALFVYANSHDARTVYSKDAANSPVWLTYIKYSLDFLRPITTAEAFEAVDWLADLP